MLRTTNNEISAHVLYDLQRASGRLTATQHKLSSGKEVSAVEDDPVAASRAMYLSSQLAEVQQYQKNVGEAQGWLSATDSSIGSVSDVMKRAKELVTQAANSTLSQTDLNAIGSEVSQLIEAARSGMNASYAGRYLFSGSKTLTEPYPAPGVAYAGDGNAVQRIIGDGQQLDVNLTGPQAFAVPPTAAGQNVMQLLTQVSSDLASGNTAALGNADLSAVDTMIDQLSGARAAAGSRVNRLDTQQSRLQDLELNVQDLLSKTQDADMAKTMVDFSTQQSIYQSALQSGARVVQPSLLDFLK